MKSKITAVTSFFELKFFVLFIYSFKVAATTHEKKNIDNDSDDIEKNINSQLILLKTNNSSRFKNLKNTLNIVIMKKKIIFRMTTIMKIIMIKLQFLKTQIRKRKIVDIFNNFEIFVMISDEKITIFAKKQKRFKISKNSIKKRNFIVVSTEKMNDDSDFKKRQEICQSTKINKFFKINNNNGNADSKSNETFDILNFFDFSNVFQSSFDKELFFVELTKFSNISKIKKFSFSSSFKSFSEENDSFSDDVNHTSLNIIVKFFSSSSPSSEKFKKARRRI